MAVIRLPRAHRSRTTSLVAILLLTVALAAFLAYEVWDAERSNRETATRTIEEYAKFAAWEYSVNTKDLLYESVFFAFSPISDLEIGVHGSPLPPPSKLAKEKFSHLLCATDSSRYHFLVDLRHRTLTTSGDRPSAAMRAWILDTVPKNARAEYKRDMSFALISSKVEGRPRTIVYQLKRDPYAKPAAAYGFELCISQFAKGSFRKVFDHFAILPPTLTGGAPTTIPNDSILSVRVFDGVGNELFRSPIQYPSIFSGEYKLEAYGGLTTKVSLKPEMANSLVIGGLPRSRLPLVLGVLFLTMGLAAIGLMQLRREGELARLRSDFIASVSHELRTPLAQVRMFAETLLLGRVRSDDERLRSLQIVDQEARRLTHLVENILQFSRAERRSIQLAPVAGELACQIREALESFAPVARARQVNVRTSLEDGTYAVVDPGAFRQIVLNLLDNAVKYGPAGQTITVTLARSHQRARLMVDDEGPGVAPRDRARIWEAFFRLESAITSAVAGSGIGLSVVAELVALHDGRAWVEDVPHGRGARFIVELPALDVRQQPGEPGVYAALPAGPPARETLSEQPTT